MLIQVTEFISHCLIVEINGRLDIYEVPPLRARLEELLESKSLTNHTVYFILDMRSVEYLDSNGLAVLVMLMRRARLRGGDVRLVWPKNKTAQGVLRLTGFDKVFVITDTVQAARDQFGFA